MLSIIVSMIIAIEGIIYLIFNDLFDYNIIPDAIS